LDRKRLLVNLAGHDGNILARGLVIAAPRSGSGKTMLTLGLMRSYRNAGLAVAGAKCGPDYIDPAFHAAATGKPSFNLDSWAMRPTLLGALAVAAGAACGLVLCEGVMGLFDGVAGEPGRTGSSADVAAALGWPVLLVIDASGQSQTAAAIVQGCASFDARIKIAGVVLNRVASPRHRRLASEAIEALGMPVLGALPRDEKINLPERHLGLVQAGETAGLDAALDRIAGFIEEHVDTGAVLSCARGATALACGGSAPALPPPAQRIAVARDKAFSFLYPHILAGWRNAGAEIAFFSPLANEPPPDHCDLCWLPGGYPELHAGPIAGAERFLEGLRRFAETRPAHGECGGYMVLGQSLTDQAGHAHPMAGLLGASFSFAKRKLHLGYRQARLVEPHPLGAKGALLRGHEFHYAAIKTESEGDLPFAFVRDAHGGAEQAEGNRRGNVSGSFFHIIAADEPGTAASDLLDHPT
jgi:cobyrinic acid a,c-diamide synthase